jgi:hypothetical protein
MQYCAFRGWISPETRVLLIFVLNYIPNIGSIIGVAFPALLAMVQFETLVPFFVLVTSLTAIPIAIGSVLEPMLMGNGLNMSPLAIIVSLAFWGTVWGIELAISRRSVIQRWKCNCLAQRQFKCGRRRS